MHVSCCNTRLPIQPHSSLQLRDGPSSSDTDSAVVTFDTTKERIRKLFNNVELSVSSYDTAWVAMVPSPNTPNSPCFPDCLKWLMDNQLNDGSWGGLLHHHHPPLPKDTLASTLACVVALKRWSVGEHQINKGLSFIESNFAWATNKNQDSPLGFDITFPGMLEYAKDLNLEFSLIHKKDLREILYEREMELTRCTSQKREAYLAYISEGLRGDLYDWNMVMKYQIKNGSILNSPSATAAALVHHNNDNAGCLKYLRSLMNKFGNAVPTMYPFEIYARLCMVDTLKSLGITRHFREEIQNVLDETFRCWVERDEQIFKDVVTCALAFRVLRTNGYDVSSDPLAEIIKDGAFMNSFTESFKDEHGAVEVYKASQITHHKEMDLGSKLIDLEVEAFRFPFNESLERMYTRRNIKHYNVDNTRTLKATFRSLDISNKDYLRLAVEDFNTCQSIHRAELESLERWVVENRLDKLKFVRQRAAYCYFSAALVLSSPELSDARITWAKNSYLTGVLDDFFDVGGSMDELVNLVQSVEKWHVNVDNDCCSEEVRIIFLALKDAVKWIGDRAFKHQMRSVTSHLIENWLDLVRCELREAIWSRDKFVPTMNEYMENGYVSVALGPIVLPVLYFVGPKLSTEVIESSEYHNMFKLMGTQGRLLNDIQSYKRELEEGKLNAVTLHTNGKEEAIEEMKKVIRNKREKLWRLVVQVKGSIVPRACKDVFWSMCNVLNLFYDTEDGYTENSILDIVKEIIYDPVSPNQSD